MTVSPTAPGSREECIAYMPLAHIHELLLETMMVRGCPPCPAFAAFRCVFCCFTVRERPQLCYDQLRQTDGHVSPSPFNAEQLADTVTTRQTSVLDQNLRVQPPRPHTLSGRSPNRAPAARGFHWLSLLLHCRPLPPTNGVAAPNRSPPAARYATPTPGAWPKHSNSGHQLPLPPAE